MNRRADAIVVLAAAAAAAGAAAWPGLHHRPRPFDATMDLRDPASRDRYTIVHASELWRLDDSVPPGWNSLHHGQMTPAGPIAIFVADDGTRIRFRRVDHSMNDFA